MYKSSKLTRIIFPTSPCCMIRSAHMHNNTLALPDYATYTSEKSNRPLQQWCEGILAAHSMREAFWQGAWNKMQAQAPEKAPLLAKDLQHCLLMFMTFADPEKVIDEANAKDKSGEALAKKLPTIAKSLQTTLVKYISISGELATYLPNQFETFKQDSQPSS